MEEKMLVKLRATVDKAVNNWLSDDGKEFKLSNIEKAVFERLDEIIVGALSKVLGVEFSFGEARVQRGSRIWTEIETAASKWLEKHPDLFATETLTPKQIASVKKRYRESLLEEATELAMERGKADAAALVEKTLNEVKID